MKTLLVLCLIVVVAGVCEAQWVQTSGPPGGIVRGFADNGTNVFAGIDFDNNRGGVFATSNYGASWVQTGFGNGLANLKATCFAAIGSNVYAGTNAGVYVSTNNGANWTPSSNGMTNTLIRSLLVSGAKFYAGAGGVVYLSTNNGVSWTPTLSVGAHYFLSLAVIDSCFFARADQYGRIFRTTNNGATWDLVSPPGNSSSMAVIGTNLFVGTYRGGIAVYRSTNYGASWTPSIAGLTDTAVQCLYANGGYLIAAMNDGGVCVSTDSARSWRAAGLADYHVTSFGGNVTRLFAGTTGGDGVLVTTDMGVSWASASSGLPLTASRVLSFAVTPNGSSGTNLFAVGQGYGGVGGRVSVTTDNGTSWTGINSGLSNMNVYLLGVSGTNLLAAAGDWSAQLFFSTNNGANWTQVNSGPPTGTSVKSFAVSGANTFAGFYQRGVYRSTNNGWDWAASNNGLTDTAVVAFAIDGTNIFTATYREEFEWVYIGGVFYSSNQGNSWRGTGLTDATLCLAVSPNGMGGTNLFAATRLRGVLLSTDNGTSWTPVNSGLPTNTSIETFAVSGTNVFAGSTYPYGGGVFLTTNNGTSWNAVNTGLPTNTPVNAMAAGGANLFIGTSGYGVWRRPLSEMITDIKMSTELPRQFSLDQNYPNPFNPSTSINYQLPTNNYVTLQVFDMLGREVATLVNESKPAGSYSLDWKAENMPSGVYFCRLTANGQTATRKMLLMR